MSNRAKLNPIERFLIWSAGADPTILAKESCLTDKYKYESIGTTIVLTSIMAFFSGGYALFTVFGSIPISLSMGTAWSYIIFNLDRFFILSTNKRKSTSKLQFFAASSLRLSIAILLSLVVAKPLELRLFEQEINQELQQNKTEKLRERIKNQEAELKSSLVEAEIQSLREERKQRFNEFQIAVSNAIQEAEGRGVTGQVGKGGVYEDWKERENYLKQEIENIDNKIQIQQNKKDEFAKFQEQQRKLFVQQLEEETGSLLDRLTTLEGLSKKDSTVGTINWFITLLFIIIETSPILVKMLSKEGVYESLLEKKEGFENSKEHLRYIKEQEILKIEELKDFEVRVETLIAEYLRLKEITKEKIENIGIQDIIRISDLQSQETNKFITLCKKRIESYEYLTNQVVASDVDENLLEKLNYTQNGAKRQLQNSAETLD